MKVICNGRGTGKTTELIEMASGEPYYLVCATHRDAYWIAEKAKEMGKDILFPLTFDEFLSHAYYGKNVGGFLIDNVDLLVQYISRDVEVKAITVSLDSV